MECSRFVEPNPLYPKHIGVQIIKDFRQNPTNESLTRGHDVQFSEFLQYLIDLGDHHRHFDEHWDSYDKLCDPCAVRYNAIMKQETLSQDFQALKQVSFSIYMSKHVSSLLLRNRSLF